MSDLTLTKEMGSPSVKGSAHVEPFVTPQNNSCELAASIQASCPVSGLLNFLHTISRDYTCEKPIEEMRELVREANLKSWREYNRTISAKLGRLADTVLEALHLKAPASLRDWSTLTAADLKKIVADPTMVLQFFKPSLTDTGPHPIQASLCQDSGTFREGVACFVKGVSSLKETLEQISTADRMDNTHAQLLLSSHSALREASKSFDIATPFRQFGHRVDMSGILQEYEGPYTLQGQKFLSNVIACTSFLGNCYDSLQTAYDCDGDRQVMVDQAGTSLRKGSAALLDYLSGLQAEAIRN